MIPLAISCIYEVTFSRQTYLHQIEANAAHAADTSHRLLALQLKHDLSTLQDIPVLLANGSSSATGVQCDDVSLRATVNKVKSAEHEGEYMGRLQHAWQTVFGGYDERQSGNCLFWLFEEPKSSLSRRSDTGDAAFAASGHGGAAVSRQHSQHADALDSSFPSAPLLEEQHSAAMGDQGDGYQPGHSETGASMGASMNSPTAGVHSYEGLPAEPLHQHPAPVVPLGRNGVGHEGRNHQGWTTGKVVVLSVTAFSAGVLVGCWPRSMSAVDGLVQLMNAFMKSIDEAVDRHIAFERQARLEARLAAQSQLILQNRVYRH